MALRRELSRKILSVPLRKLEEIGPARLMVVLTEDVLHIAQALLGAPGYGVNVALLLGGGVYLCWLSWQVVLGMAGFILLGAVGYRLLVVSGFVELHRAREAEDQLFHHFRALTEGIKELKLHRNRRSVFAQQNIQSATESYRRHNVAGETRFILAHSWGHFLFYALVGLILILLPSLKHLDPQALTGYVITALYLTGPLAGLRASFSIFGRAKVALNKVEELAALMSAHSTDDCPIAEPEKEASFEWLELN